MTSKKVKGIYLWALVALFPVHAFCQDGDGDDGEEMSFDDVVEEVHHAASGWADRVHISGRFDLNLEMENLGGDRHKADRFRTYHNFVFLKVDASENLVLEAEIVDRVYYEMKYRVGERLEFKAGRLWVPFGLTPFHHYYGGVQGDPFSGKLVPNVWAEQGAGLAYTLFEDRLGATLTGDTYAIRGFDGSGGRVLQLNGGGSEGVIAVGQRLVLHIFERHLTLAASSLYNAWGPADSNNSLTLWGGDLMADYNLLRLPLIKDLRVSAAFARAEIRDKAVISGGGWYYKYGDYLQVDYGHWRPGLVLRGRFGTYIDFDEVETAKDTHSLNIAVIRRMGPLSCMAEYFWNFEAVDETKDDFLRLHMVLEF
jgi:hypothetical protein